MDVKIKTADAEIISTGSVIIPKNEYVQFELKELKFRILFDTEKNKDGVLNDSKITTIVVGTGTESRLEIRFINYRSMFMSTPTEPFNVATIENKTLLLYFSIVSINSSEEAEDKLFYYTWYLKN